MSGLWDEEVDEGKVAAHDEQRGEVEDPTPAQAWRDEGCVHVAHSWADGGASSIDGHCWT